MASPLKGDYFFSVLRTNSDSKTSTVSQRSATRSVQRTPSHNPRKRAPGSI